MSDGKVLVLLASDHLIRIERRLLIAVSTRGYNSGFAEKWSDFYLVCAGPASAGYTYESHTFETRQVPANNDARNCSAQLRSHMADHWRQRRMSSLRHSRDRTCLRWKTARSVEAAADLNVTYRLIDHEPVLVRPTK